MKPYALAALAAIGPAHTRAQAPAVESALVITAVFDGPLSGGHPKGIELYALRDVPDLDAYGLRVVNQPAEAEAATGPQWPFPEGTSAAAGEYLHVVTDRDSFAAYVGGTARFATPLVSVNGDDAVTLYRGGDVVDVLGEPSRSGDTTGLAWAYTDGYVYRLDGTRPGGGEFVPADFAYSGPHALDGCGGGTNAECATAIPLASYSPTALPVTLTALAAEPHVGGALVTWTAASQRDNDYFAVEVSATGGVYTEVGRVAGAGTTSVAADYAFAYETAASGLHYFRLRQVDHDGREEHSEVVTAVLGESSSGLHVVGAPRGGALALEVARAGTLEVVDLVGRRWRRVSVAEVGAYELDVSALPAGVYVVTDGYTSRRFAKGR